MANNNSNVQQQQQQQQQQQPHQHFQQMSTAHTCKDCGIYLNSAESLEVHLQYHKENLMKSWAPAEIKEERASPISHQPPPPPPPNNYGQFSETPQYYGMDTSQQYNQDFTIHKAPTAVNTNYRYHPYQSQASPYDRSQHSPYDRSQSSHFMFPTEHQQGPIIKTEEDAQSEILDLDSHKVQRMFMNGPEQKLFSPTDFISNNVSTTTPQDNVVANGIMQPNYANNVVTTTQDNVGNGMNLQQNYGGAVTTTTTSTPHHQDVVVGNGFNHQPNYSNVTTTTPQDSVGNGLNLQQSYHRPFEHLPSPGNNPVITSSQVTPNPQQPPTVSPAVKSTNWKSNEARRPKTYNCTACNKWFTSSGHLKRHYNTTLHKNAVKTSGQPDPASLPISAHHHPARESSSSRESNQSNSPPQHENDTNGSPPNGEAGLSPGINTTRGLLTSPHFMGPPPHQSPPTMAPSPLMMPTIENSQFQMYPNGSAPHVTQDMATNSLNITGEYPEHHLVEIRQQESQSQQQQQQQQQQQVNQLPSFEHIAHRFSVFNFGNANVGGGGPATAPYAYVTDPYELNEPPRILNYKTVEDEYRLTVLTTADPAPYSIPIMYESSDQYISNNNNNNNNNNNHEIDLSKSPSPEKAHIKRDYEEQSIASPLITSTIKSPKSVKSVLLKCTDCDKVFNKACYLTQHNKTFHCGEKPIKCTKCGKRFDTDPVYQTHYQKHLGEKPHKCDQCPKQFNHKTDLRRHLCLHSGKKPFECKICGKGFIRKDHMQKHSETHLKKTLNNKMVGRRSASDNTTISEVIIGI